MTWWIRLHPASKIQQNSDVEAQGVVSLLKMWTSSCSESHYSTQVTQAVKSYVIITGGNLRFDGACSLYLQENSDAECVGDEFLKIVLHTRLHGVTSHEIRIRIFKTLFSATFQSYAVVKCAYRKTDFRLPLQGEENHGSNSKHLKLQFNTLHTNNGLLTECVTEFHYLIWELIALFLRMKINSPNKKWKIFSV